MSAGEVAGWGLVVALAGVFVVIPLAGLVFAAVVVWLTCRGEGADDDAD
jgi:hypothetical protein